MVVSQRNGRSTSQNSWAWAKPCFKSFVRTQNKKCSSTWTLPMSHLDWCNCSYLRIQNWIAYVHLSLAELHRDKKTIFQAHIDVFGLRLGPKSFSDIIVIPCNSLILCNLCICLPFCWFGLLKPSIPQELEGMMDLFHSFDDTNSGVLKKVLGFMWPFTEKDTKEEQETKGRKFLRHWYTFWLLFLFWYILTRFDTFWYLLIHFFALFCMAEQKLKTVFFFPGKCELHSLRGKVEVWVALSNLGLLPHLDQAVCRRRSRGEGQLQC